MRYGTRSSFKRRWTPLGHRPECRVKIAYEFGYLYAAICPFSGDLFALLLPSMKKECFKIFVEQFERHLVRQPTEPEPEAGAERAETLLIVDGAGSHQESVLSANSRLLEYRLLEAARAAGVPSPEPVFFGDDSLGGAFFLVRRVEGETLPRRLLRDDAYARARNMMTAQLGAILAKIHAIPLDAPGIETLPSPPEGESAVAHELNRYEQTFRAVAPEPHPAFELAFRWLRAHLPPANERRTLVHGDFRMGNVLFDAEGAQLILDWELAHAGDPMEDLAWMCVRSWRFGGDKPVGGIGEREAAALLKGFFAGRRR